MDGIAVGFTCRFVQVTFAAEYNIRQVDEKICGNCQHKIVQNAACQLCCGFAADFPCGRQWGRKNVQLNLQVM